ncbi:aldo-keto reductase [Diplodia corticola]|uniref:Aldo-keto reductase n=1 Tax=Diplodia corticola TaxID=236234 RepID=A0A1J9R8C4_9PEZI|nr:aldo-keto reductase [Diplodia corticola]OJD36832.1 aldo-keto reductase [Diplodia corticola]
MLNYRKWAETPVSIVKSVRASRAEYRRLGKSGLVVSNPIMGGMHIGSSKWYEWWDTANIYSNGESERIMGKTLKVHNIPRSKIIIMTKCFRPVTDPEIDDVGSCTAFSLDLARQSKDYVNHCGLSRTAIFQQVEASLKRLDTGYIDVLQIHRFDPNTPPEETMKALHDLVQANVVRYLGASSMWAHELAILQHTAEKHGWTKLVSMQNHYNLLYREEEREMIKYCNYAGIGLIPWSPLASGRLARPPGQQPNTFRAVNGQIYRDHNPEVSKEIVSRVHHLATSRGLPMSHVALAWLDARGLALSVDEEKYLEESYRPQPIQGHS